MRLLKIKEDKREFNDKVTEFLVQKEANPGKIAAVVLVSSCFG